MTTDSHNPEVETRRFVGRGLELAVLAEELSLTITGQTSRVVALTGPPGIGKTGLATAYRARTERRARWLVGRAVPGRSGLRLATVLDAVPEATASLASVRAWLAGATDDRPVVLWLEDLHAADAASQEVVGHLGRSPIPGPLLVLVTVRADALTSSDLALTLGGLIKDGLAREVRVPPLTESEIAAVADSVLGPAAVASDMVSWLVDRTRGNPLLLTAVLEDLVGNPGRRSAAKTVQERARAMLRSLSHDSVLAAELAAVIGAPFVVSELLALDAEAASGVDQLVVAGLLVEDAGTRRLEFGHPILQEAVYEMTGPARRARLHRLVADRLPLPLGSRAYHLGRGAVPGDVVAVEALRAAGADAVESGSPAVAVRHLQEAARLVAGADKPLRAAVLDELAGAADVAGDHAAGIPALRELLHLAATPDDRVTTRLRLASFLSAGSGDLAEANRLVAEAVATARASAPTRLSAALNEFGWIRGEGGDLDGEVRFASEALSLADAGGDLAGQLHALGPLAHALMLLGRHGQAAVVSERAVTLARALGDGFQLDWHLAVQAQVLAAAGQVDAALGVLDGPVSAGMPIADVAYAVHVMNLWLGGRWDAARTTAKRLLAASPVHVPVRTAWAFAMAGAIEAAAGRADRARQLLTLADRAYGGRRFYTFSALHDWAAGVAAWVQGDPRSAIERLERSAAWLEEMRAAGLVMFVLPYICAIGIEAGAHDAARHSLVRAERLTASSPVGRSAALCCAALLGEAAVTEAAATADGAGLRFLAALVLATGNPANVADAARRYAGMPAPVLEGRCRHALRTAGAHGRRAARGAGSLTGREQQVVALARRGMMTARIAASLSISERTVESHLAHAYAKLGIAGRHELHATAEQPQPFPDSEHLAPQ
jgi:ATP/maltotriose-dependent transcriptional regulator MalT